MKKRLLLITIILLSLYWYFQNHNSLSIHSIGSPIDSLHGVHVYYNGDVKNISGRNVTSDKYNLGLKYQCVEFVKRYYYEHYHHKMPDSYGHAKDYFDSSLKEGALNTQRNLYQFRNPGSTKPEVGDLLIFSPTFSNKFGHVAIVSKVTNNEVEIIQQNPGRIAKSRVNYTLRKKGNSWTIKNDRIMGWLRK